jgi:hypothetical protein
LQDVHEYGGLWKKFLWKNENIVKNFDTLGAITGNDPGRLHFFLRSASKHSAPNLLVAAG